MHGTHQEPGETILLHHFDDLGQQKDTSSLGMWAFLATEVMFFGGLFGAYVIYRNQNLDAFVAASRFLNVTLGAFNTGVLLCSSLTMAMAVHAAQLRQDKKVPPLLVATLILGSIFLGIKAYEWHVDYKEHLVPGIDFNWEEAQKTHGHHEPADAVKPMAGMESSRQSADPQVNPGTEITATTDPGKAQVFFLLYFMMTGLHAFHMVIGIVIVGLTAYLSWRGWFSGGGETQIEMVGLYWHFIDVVWVFLYPLLYLIDVRK